MDNTGQAANSQQLRPPSYGDLCRPPGGTTVADTMSAAYHSRYLASLPLSSGAGFPFFSSMLPGALPASTSPFRAPSAPGVGNMRQFWPPTPPPDGYGRYGMNTSLFPLFGSSVSPSPDSGTYMTQGLVSRLNTAGHLSHLIDKDPTGFFTPSYGLGTPLTPSSHVTPTTHFSHLIPPLEKHPGYGHMTLGTKELEDVHDASDLHSSRVHLDYCKPDIPYRYAGNTQKLKSDKNCEKIPTECRKSSPSLVNKDRPDEVKPFRGKSDAKFTALHPPPSKVTPCEIDISCAPTIKPDILSPPIDSPRSDVPPSPNLLQRKQDAVTPLHYTSPPLSSSSFSSCSSSNVTDNFERKCSGCVANSKNLIVKVNGCSSNLKISPVPDTRTISLSESEMISSPHSTFSHRNQATVVSTWSTTTPKPSSPETASTGLRQSSESNCVKEMTVTCDNLQRVSTKSPDSPDYHDPVFHGTQPNISRCESDRKSSHTPVKHVTAAVIPTAPKQNIIQNQPHSLSSNETKGGTFGSDLVSGESMSESLHKVKFELNADSLSNGRNSKCENLPYQQQQQPASSCCKYTSKNNSLCKMKETIKAIDCTQKASVKPTLSTGPLKEPREDLHITIHTNSPVDAIVPTSDNNVPCSPAHVNSIDNNSNSSIELHNENKRKVSPVKSVSPSCKLENTQSTDCQFPQITTPSWTKATVSPFNWQKSLPNSDEHQAINLTINKKNEGMDAQEKTDIGKSQDNTSDTTVSLSIDSQKSSSINESLSTMPLSSGIIGVCHPNTKNKVIPNCANKFAPISAPPEITTEVHVSMKTSVQTVQHSVTPPIGLKNNNMLNSSFHAKTLKAERITTKRGKIDTEKILPNTKSSLATLAPKLTKKIGFLKEGKSSHTLSTSSSMSSTSIVFPASVNPCIPVGIAIAQQRQDTTTSANAGKMQSSVQSSTSGIIAASTHLTNRVTEIQQPSQEIVREQKTQDIGCSTTANNADPTNFLVTQGPTIVSRQWESEAVTRATLPSPWMAHGPVVAPAVWIGQVGQGAYAATPSPTQTTVAPAPVNSLETPPVSLPPGGYQLARDSVTGHLFLIPAANIVDRTSVWPSYQPATTGNALPIQQLVTQQHHTQFEQVLPQASEPDHSQDCLSVSVRQTQVGEPTKDLTTVDSCCLSSGESMINNASAFKTSDHQVKISDKSDNGTPVPSVPLASGQTFTFTTFPTNCDPSGFSYVLQSSTVMHLAHTQTTASIQTESGKRSQGTSPLHSATPSPPLNSSAQVTDDDIEEESDNDNEDVISVEQTHVKLTQQCQSVTTAIQVDMDCQTNSEAEEEEEVDCRSDIIVSKKVEMSDSANQTEGGLSDSNKGDFESDSSESFEDSMSKGEGCISNDDLKLEAKTPEVSETMVSANSPEKSDASAIIVMQEEEPFPLLPVESKPVMDFIDHHGLDLLVDSIEEFASREKDASSDEKSVVHTDEYIEQKDLNQPPQTNETDVESNRNSEKNGNDIERRTPDVDNASKTMSSSYRTIDTSCTDGLGLLCALAEQRFLEESLNDNMKDTGVNISSEEDDFTTNSNSTRTIPPMSVVTETVQIADVKQKPPFEDNFIDPFDMSSTPAELHACELEMRKRLADLQREYKEKQLQLARLLPKFNANEVCNKNEEEVKPNIAAAVEPKKANPSCFKRKSALTRKSRSSFTSAQSIRMKAGKRLLSNSLMTKKALLQKNQFKKEFKSRLADKKMQQQDSSASKHNNSALNKTVSQESSCSKKSVSNFKAKVTNKPNSSALIGTSPKEKSDNKKLNGDKKMKNNVKHQQELISKKKKKDDNKIDTKNVKKQKPGSVNGNSELKTKKEEKSVKTLETHARVKNEVKKEERPKKPFFDEQAWLVRRSERIFLSDAKVPLPQTPPNSAQTTNTPKKTNIVQANQKPETASKDKKEKSKHAENTSPKKRHVSESSVFSSKSSEFSSFSLTDSESSDEASSQSDNLPLSMLIAARAEKPKRIVPDSDSNEASSVPSEDIPLSDLITKLNPKAVELRSCILTPSDLEDKTRVLILDEGLFYAGHITAVEAPDVYGIILDGERAHRPHIFSREEILNAAVLEVKPTHALQVPQGCRICAFWSQQYRCLYPGTVTKASSPLPDDSLLSVEFDDGDSGRIPLEDIRMLPPDFPIVSMEPNPLLILGKRRARSDKESANEQKLQSSSVQKPEKSTLKIKRKRTDSLGNKNEKDSTKVGMEVESGKPNKLCTNVTDQNSVSQNIVCNESSSTKSSQLESKTEGKVKIKDSKKRSVSDSNAEDALATVKPKKHKKHKDEHKHHHHHHHHRHHHHHHKKHKSLSEHENSTSKSDSSKKQEENTVIPVKMSETDKKDDELSDDSLPLSTLKKAKSHKEIKIKAEKKSELTVKIKTSPSPHTATTSDHERSKVKEQRRSDGGSGNSSSSDEYEEKGSEKQKNKRKRKKSNSGENKPNKRKDRMPVEKSKIAAFLPMRQLWRWSGKGYRRPGAKGKGKKEFYRAIQRGKELLKVGDSAVFLSTGRPHLPYIGRIETMWESWGGKMDVKVKWFYHPEETKNGKRLTQLKGALFQSPHFDENDVQTISHKCEVLSYEEYQTRKGREGSPSSTSTYNSLFDNNDIYYLAGTYDPITGSLIMEPGVPKIPALES